MANPSAKAYTPGRLEKIARQIQRIESHEREWEADTDRAIARSTERGGEISHWKTRAREVHDRVRSKNRNRPLRWESGPILGRLDRWGDCFERLCHEMVQQTRRPFSVRTQQISVLCAFIPFVLSIMIASVRFMPNLPSMALWSKFTWFLGIPIILSVAGALVGFMVGVMLDTLERQSENATTEGKTASGSEPTELMTAPLGAKSAVWVAVEDLQPNQRVAETVVGPNEKPILLRHTLLKPSHIEMLREQNVDKVQIEAITYPSGSELAVAS